MSYENHINKFSDAAAIQEAIDNGVLVKPYVALDASAGTIDWNSKNITPDPCEGYSSQEECECVEGGGYWDGSECIYPVDCAAEWQERGYESYEDCRCAEYGECPEPPVPTMGEWSVDSDGHYVFTMTEGDLRMWDHQTITIGYLNNVYVNSQLTQSVETTVFYDDEVSEWLVGTQEGTILFPYFVSGTDSLPGNIATDLTSSDASVNVTWDANNQTFTFSSGDADHPLTMTTVNPPYPSSQSSSE